MNINDWKSCVFWKIKYGFMGKIFWKLFKYQFTLSREEILYRYPNMENNYIKRIKEEINENVIISFNYSENKNTINVYYTVNGEQILYESPMVLIPNYFCKRKFSKKDIERIGKIASNRNAH